ncbi:MAG: 1-acyl-sn-glycerol-3-phosphate acyltransferase [Betaproteobacteria bacterium]|nr:1-acyl-sn-glycerol-3-phosphate acyltransferase [Betaproteobacteria bacterium]
MRFVMSVLHLIWMTLTVVPYALYLLSAALLGASSDTLYKVAKAWLTVCISSARLMLDIQYRIQGFENLPIESTSPAILLVKHQSTYETFLLPAIMPHPLAYVFKKELLSIPFFGWSIGRLAMIHIDRKEKAQAFNKVVTQGKALLDQGIWVIMFPEGTRIDRGQKGIYKTGGTRLAIETGVPVIPIAITSAKCWPRKAFVKQSGIVDVSIGKPIPSLNRQPEEFMREVETWIESEMHRLDAQAYLSSS